MLSIDFIVLFLGRPPFAFLREHTTYSQHVLKSNKPIRLCNLKPARWVQCGDTGEECGEVDAGPWILRSEYTHPNASLVKGGVVMRLQELRHPTRCDDVLSLDLRHPASLGVSFIKIVIPLCCSRADNLFLHEHSPPPTDRTVQPRRAMSEPQAYYQSPGHVIAAGVVLSVVDIIAVVARLWVRKRQKQGLKADDWLMIPAAVSACLEKALVPLRTDFPV